jgi:hypothetical protein
MAILCCAAKNSLRGTAVLILTQNFRKKSFFLTEDPVPCASYEKKKKMKTEFFCILSQ